MQKAILFSGGLAAVLVAGLACAEGDRPFQPTSVPVLSVVSEECIWPGTWYTTDPQIANNLRGGENEEEVFGHITSPATTWSVTITDRDQTTASNQAGSYLVRSMPANFGPVCNPYPSNQTGTGNLNTGAEWGWYAFGGFGDQCVNKTNKNQNHPERHRPQSAQGTPFVEDYETHCVDAGRFTITLRKEDTPAFVREVDFVGYAAADQNREEITESPPGNGGEDVLLDVIEGTGPKATPLINLSATKTPYDPEWIPLQLQPDGKYHAPSNFRVRFNAMNSLSHSTSGGGDPQQLLVRYFWNIADPADRSGFTNIIAGGTYAIVRVKTFTQGQRDVRMHVVQPYERPADPTDMLSVAYGDTLRLPFYIDSPLTAVLTPTTANAVVGAPVQFTVTGLNGGSGIQYRWEFGTGEGVIDYPAGTATVNYAFTSAGTKTVTLYKRDTYQSVVKATATATVTVGPPTNVATSNIAPTSATITWTNGNASAKTTIQRRVNGTTPWTTVDSVLAGLTTYNLTNLTPCTRYDANLYHVPSAPTTILALFFTPAVSGACTPLNFTLVNCYVQGNGRYYNVAWTRTEYGFHSNYEIGRATTNNPASATVITSGSSSTVATTLGPYSTSLSTTYYFWVRHTLNGGSGASSWGALDMNPLIPNQAC